MTVNKPISNSLICTKVLLDAYTLLREKLNGKCDDNTCPRDDIRFGTLFSSAKRLNLFCYFCHENWNCLDYYFIDGFEYHCCPCHCKNLSEKDLFLRLDEVINQLETKLKKEYC